MATTPVWYPQFRVYHDVHDLVSNKYRVEMGHPFTSRRCWGAGEVSDSDDDGGSSWVKSVEGEAGDRLEPLQPPERRGSAGAASARRSSLEQVCAMTASKWMLLTW